MLEMGQPAAAGATDDAGEGDLRSDLHGRRDRGLERGAGHRRFLGALVRPLQTARPGARSGGDRGRRQGEDGQDQRRREPAGLGPAAGSSRSRRSMPSTTASRSTGSRARCRKARSTSSSARWPRLPAKARSPRPSPRRREMLEAGALDDAAQTFAAILEEDDKLAAAYAGLAEVKLAQGDLDQAEAVLNGAPAEISHAAGDRGGAHAKIALARQAENAGPLDDLRAKVEADPADPEARFELAQALHAAGDVAGGGRRPARDHPARRELERRRRQDPAVHDLRRPGGERSDRARRAAQAVVAAVRMITRSRSARPDPALPASGRADVAARPAAAQHLRAALPGDARRRAEDPAPADRHDPARRRARRAAARDRLCRPDDLVQRDRRQPLHDHPDRDQPVSARGAPRRGSPPTSRPR